MRASAVIVTRIVCDYSSRPDIKTRVFPQPASRESEREYDQPHDGGRSYRAAHSTVTGLISRRRGSTSFEKSRMPFSDSAWVMKPERPTRLRWPKPPTLS